MEALSEMDALPLAWKRAMQTIHNILLTHRGHQNIAIHPEQHHVLFSTSSPEESFSSPPHSLWVIYFCSKDKLNIDGLKEVIAVLETFQSKHCFLVFKNVITSSAKKALENIMEFHFELWNLKELQYDITKHHLFVPHERLRPEEITQCFQDPKAIQFIPKIHKSDVVVRYFDYHKGDVLRVRRKDGTIAYRIVR